MKDATRCGYCLNKKSNKNTTGSIGTRQKKKKQNIRTEYNNKNNASIGYE